MRQFPCRCRPRILQLYAVPNILAQYFFSLFMASFIFYAQYSYLFQPSEEGDPQNTPTYRGRPSRSPRNMT